MYNIWQLIGIWSLLVSVPFIWRGIMLLGSESQQILGRQQATFRAVPQVDTDRG